MAVTGMRVGEAIGFDRDAIDAANGRLVIRNGKFGKSGELPSRRRLPAPRSASASCWTDIALAVTRVPKRGGHHKLLDFI